MELENSYLIDWLSFTVRTADPLDVIEKVGIQELEFTEIDTARYGYDKGYTVNGIINVFYSEKRSDMGVHVEMTGQGVRKFETLMELAKVSWLEVLAHLRTFVRFSRIDLALDEYEGLVNFNDIIGKIDRGEHVGRCRSLRLLLVVIRNGEHTGTNHLWVAISLM